MIIYVCLQKDDFIIHNLIDDFSHFHFQIFLCIVVFSNIQVQISILDVFLCMKMGSGQSWN